MEKEQTAIKKTSKLPKLILKLSVSVGLIAFLLSKIDIVTLKHNLSTVSSKYVLLALLFIILNYIVSSVRWKNLLVINSTAKPPLSYFINLYFIGSFFNNFMPTSIGGDVYKIFKLGKKTGDTVLSFTATFTERFLGVIALVIISLFGLVNQYGYIALLLLIGLFVGLIVGIFFLKFIATKIRIAQKIYDSILVYKNYKKILWTAFIYSFVVQFLAIFSPYFVFASLNTFPPIGYAVMVLPVITLASFFIPSLNGIGVQDALFVSMFAVVGVSTETAISASILYHIFRLVVSLFGGILYALGRDE